MEFPEIAIPDGPIRRLGADQYVEEMSSDFSRRLKSIDELFEQSLINLDKATTLLTSLVNEFTSFLYAVGADHEVWRHWASLTAFGLLLSGEIHRAGQYAALGGEWDFIKALPDIPVTSHQEADQVTWMLIREQPIIQLKAPKHGYGLAWLKLARSISSGDNKTTERCFKLIANFWMEETGGDWNNFYFGRYPVFETPICAVAALVRHKGFVPTSLNSKQYRFLEAGLAKLEPPAMFPELFSLQIPSENNK